MKSDTTLIALTLLRCLYNCVADSEEISKEGVREMFSGRSKTKLPYAHIITRLGQK